MPRLARRRADPKEPARPRRSLPIREIWRPAGPVLGLAAAVGMVLWLESSSLWSTLRSTIQSLDFDPSRATLILAWLAAVALAAVAALLTGRPWISALTATVFTAITYVWPFGERVRQEIPEIFGLKETLQPAVLWHNQAVALGVTLVTALMAAATADLVRRGAVGLGTTTWLMARTRRFQGEPLLALAAGFAIGLTSVTGLVLAAGVDPVLRYGPEHGVYLAPAVSPRPASTLDPAQPGTTPQPMPAHGQVLERVYHSNAMGEDRRFLIYLPPSYELKRAAKRRYPVLYLLHGDPGGPPDWSNSAPRVSSTPGLRRAPYPKPSLSFRTVTAT